MNTAKFVTEIKVNDPDFKVDMPVHICILKDNNSKGVFGIDSSYLEQLEDDCIIINSPFNDEELRVVGLD